MAGASPIAASGSAGLLLLPPRVVAVERRGVGVIEVLLPFGEVAPAEVGGLVSFHLLALGVIPAMAVLGRLVLLGGLSLGEAVAGVRVVLLVVVAHVAPLQPMSRRGRYPGWRGPWALSVQEIVLRWSSHRDGPGDRRRSTRGQPGGQLIERPPSRWRWRWGTVWPPAAPMLVTTR